MSNEPTRETRSARTANLALVRCPAFHITEREDTIEIECRGTRGAACDALESGCVASDFREATDALESLCYAELYGDDWPECCIDDAS